MSDPHDEFRGKNVPILLQPLSQVAAQHGLGANELEKQLGECRKQLHGARAARPRPGLDDKVSCDVEFVALGWGDGAGIWWIARHVPSWTPAPCPIADCVTACRLCDRLQIVTAWNGYGISAFARAARTLAAEQPPVAASFPVEGEHAEGGSS